VGQNFVAVLQFHFKHCICNASTTLPSTSITSSLDKPTPPYYLIPNPSHYSSASPISANAFLISEFETFAPLFNLSVKGSITFLVTLRCFIFFLFGFSILLKSPSATNTFCHPLCRQLQVCVRNPARLSSKLPAQC